MPSPPISRPAEAGLAARIAAQQAQIERLEARLWRDAVPAEALLADYQAAFRALEDLIAQRGADRRHRIVIVIPVADSPRQLGNCLASLRKLCELYRYGGMHNGRYRKVALLLADDSADAAAIVAHRRLLRELDAFGIDSHYFGLEQQLELLGRVAHLDLGNLVGRHPRERFSHKGQALMRNIAYLKLAELQAAAGDERLLFHTVDADQEFRIRVAGADGAHDLFVLNYFHQLDRIFDEKGCRVLTGKVVGDPPVSPAVMAGNFLDDVIAMLEGLADVDPDAAYRQPDTDTGGSDEAAYHDMADLFGFSPQRPAYGYRCTLPGEPDNAACLDEFSQRLNSFFHGQHPTRVTWFRYSPAHHSVTPARTVYTGNYVFSAAALDCFIPFATLRLRMSGPTMGRLLMAALGGGFVSANLPMLHNRTLPATRTSEYRPGVVSRADGAAGIDLSDEFERQFFGDVMLFALQRLSAAGYPADPPQQGKILRVLDQVHDELQHKYRARRQRLEQRLQRLAELLHDPRRWWQRSAASADALERFDAFIANLRHNFATEDRPDGGASDDWAAWRARLLQAIEGLSDDREHWRQALALLADPPTA